MRRIFTDHSVACCLAREGTRCREPEDRQDQAAAACRPSPVSQDHQNPAAAACRLSSVEGRKVGVCLSEFERRSW